MKIAKKIVASVVVLSMLVSVAACSSKKDKSKDEVISAAEEYAEAIVARKPKNIIKLCNEDAEELQELLEEALDFEEVYGSETGAVYTAIADAMTAEVDEDSVEVDGDEASVDIIVTLPDYEAVAEDDDNMVDADTFIEALADADTVDHKVSVDFEKNDDDEWVVSNLEKNLEKAYPFIYSNISFAPALIDAVEGIEFWFDDNGVYTDYTSINFELEIYGVSDYSVYYTVDIDGHRAYTSEPTDDADIYYGSEQEAETTDDGYLIPGTYTVTFFDATNDTQLAQDSVQVVVSNGSTPSTPSTPSNPPSASDVNYTWYYADSSNGQTAVYEDYATIDLDVTLTSSVSGYYTVAYNGTVVYTSETETTAWFEGYYGPSQNAAMASNGCLPSGEYTLTFYTADGTQFASGVATVINTSDDGSTTPTTPSTPSTPTTPVVDGDLYVADLDLTDWINASFADSFAGATTLEGTLTIKFNLVLGDGEFQMYANYEDFVGAYLEFIDGNIESILLASMNMTKDEAEALIVASGQYASWDAFIEDARGQMMSGVTDSMADNLQDVNVVGTYVIDGDTITLTSSTTGGDVVGLYDAATETVTIADMDNDVFGTVSLVFVKQ